MSTQKHISLINASAGSGKTYRLTNDLVNLLTDDSNPVDAQKILATTFTRKAAAELMQRLRQVLLEKNEPDKAQQVRDGLVGTVNSVCGQVIMEHAVSLGLSPALDVLEEDNAKRIFKLAVVQELDAAAKAIDGYGKLAWRLGKSPRQQSRHNQKTSDWQQDVQDIVDSARKNGLGPDDLQHCADKSIQEVNALLKNEVPFPWKELKEKVEQTLEDSKTNSEFNPKETKSHRAAANVLKGFLREPTWSNCAGLIKLQASKKLDFLNEPGRLAAKDLFCSQDLTNDLTEMIKKVFSCAANALRTYERYKQEQGLIDFVDQETIVRNALNGQGQNTFRQGLQERLEKVMVDEFQDTSPIQLDLFLKLHNLAEQGSQWVGDPKQAIYGFRGTAPELMLEFARNKSDKIKNSTLEYSWRSQERLINFVNAVFLPAFRKDLNLGNEPDEDSKVTLKLPDEHKEWTGGQLEAWQLSDSNTYACLAAGIQTLLQGNGEKTWRPADLAVLCRSNQHCKKLAEELNQLGIAASAPRGNLLETFEGSLAMAAYRYCINHNDTTALVILIANLGLDADWLKKLSKQNTDEQRQAVFRTWGELPQIKKLHHLPNETNLEILERAVISLDLDRVLRRYPNPTRRLRNLDELRKACVSYLEECEARRIPSSPAGFVAWANDAELLEAASEDADTVNVLTYHKAKGLEWPVVILADLNQDERATPFRLLEVSENTTFDQENPLAGRSLRYIPYPFGDKSTLAYNPSVDAEEVDLLEELLQGKHLQEKVSTLERQENRRLLYVGFTRAREMLVLTLNKRTDAALTKEAKQIQQTDYKDKDRKVPSQKEIKAGLLQYEATWLDDLSDDGEDRLFKWPKLDDSSLPKSYCMQINGQDFALIFRSCAPAQPVENLAPTQCQQYLLPESTPQQLEYRLNPSEVEKPAGQVIEQFELPIKFSAKLKAGEYDLFGNAYHNFIALPEKLRTIATAKRLLQQWTVENSVAPEDLLEATKNFYDFVHRKYGLGDADKVQIECELPMTLRTADGQLYQGYIDMLLKTHDDKYVIIDHKTHSRPDDSERFAASCFGQLAIYRSAVEKNSSRPVVATLIHLPIAGKIYKVAAAPEAEACKNE